MSATNLEQLGGWPGVIGRLMRRDDLGRDDAATALGAILDGQASPAQVASFIVGLRMKGESVEEMTGLVTAMLGHAERVPVDPAGLVDTCGTGGDRHHTINVSSIAAFVVAGAGVRVCKHGNRAASSACGSADVLDALGVAIELGPDGVARCIEEAGIGFCFAPRYHPSMRHVGPVRKELGVPTVFNYLGPLANPARVRRQVVGVSDAAMAPKMLGVLRAAGAEHALVVFGHDGLDELSTTGPSTVHELRAGEERVWELDPVALGLKPAVLDDLRGGDASVNAAHARRVLAGEAGAHRDIVVLNAAAALVAAGVAGDVEAGLGLAADSIDGGRAAAALERLVAVSSAAAAAE